MSGDRKRAHYVRAHRQGESVVALDNQLSGALRSISDYDLLVIVPEGVQSLGTGDVAPALVMRE
jgi:molybdopterin biosynthesis enzyme